MTVRITALGLLVALFAAWATVATAPGGGGLEARDMRLLGHEPDTGLHIVELTGAAKAIAE
jgi:hypothetical protein